MRQGQQDHVGEAYNVLSFGQFKASESNLDETDLGCASRSGGVDSVTLISAVGQRFIDRQRPKGRSPT
jgi:hypothetical protein